MNELQGHRIPVLCRRGRACMMGAFVCDAFICERVLLKPMPAPRARLRPPDKSSNARDFEEIPEPWCVEEKR